MDIGDSSVSPTLLVSQKVSGRNITTSLYDFKNTPTGTVALTEGGFGVYYQDSKGLWQRDNFDTNGVFKQTSKYTFAELLADESTYNIDLNKDGSVGDVIAQVLTNDGKGHSLYQTVSGSYVIDDSGLSVGSATTDPTILITEKVVRGKTTASNYEFTQTPTGIVTNADGSNAVYYQDTKGNWF